MAKTLLTDPDVFNADSDPIDEDGYVWPGGWIMRPCKICGAMVIESRRGLHVEWHNSLL
jgi:hypothetical protein